MMTEIHYVTGDIFESGADAFVNPVNLDGVAGKGLALEFAGRYPRENERYMVACRTRELTLGRVIMIQTFDLVLQRRVRIIYAPTKVHWRNPSLPHYVETSLHAIASSFPTWGIKSMALPALGCGLGGLDYNTVVKPLIEQYLRHDELEVFAYLPA